MATVQPSLPRHIIVYVLTALAGAGAAVVTAACAETDETDARLGGSPREDVEPRPTRSAPPQPAKVTPGPGTAASAAPAEAGPPSDPAVATGGSGAASGSTASAPPAGGSSGAATPGRTSPTSERAPVAGSAAASEADPSAFHLDDSEVEYDVPRRPRARKGRPIEVTLRSSPAGAVAAVDGVIIGSTPAMWNGVADGTEREFTFVLPGYVIARYRFVPTQSGVVHGTLKPFKSEEGDAPGGRRPPPGAAPNAAGPATR
jgi:hypothetical protein